MPRPNPRAPRTDPARAKTMGQAEPKSRQQAKFAAERAQEIRDTLDEETWPMNDQGTPMMKVTMTAAELIPNGKFANVSVGPAQITTMIDPDKPDNFTDEQKENAAKALNELAEIVGLDVIGVQRVLVQESLAEQISENGSNDA